jgi:hypothetical protein
VEECLRLEEVSNLRLHVHPEGGPIATNVAGVAGSALLAEGMRQLLSRK